MKYFAMCKIVGTALLCLISIWGHAQSNWQLKKDEDGIKVYTGKTQNSCFKAIKVECTVNVRVSQLVAFLLDVDSQNDWVYSSKHSELVKKISANEVIFYSELSVPWPCTNRDYISHITIHQPSPQTVTIDAYTEPTLLPEKPDRVRVKNSHAHWDITSVAADEQRIIYTVQFDPGGSLPAWLVNMFVTKGPLQTFQKLKTCVAKPKYHDAKLDFIKEQS